MWLWIDNFTITKWAGSARKFMQCSPHQERRIVVGSRQLTRPNNDGGDNNDLCATITRTDVLTSTIDGARFPRSFYYTSKSTPKRIPSCTVYSNYCITNSVHGTTSETDRWTGGRIYFAISRSLACTSEQWNNTCSPHDMSRGYKL